MGHRRSAIQVIAAILVNVALISMLLPGQGGIGVTAQLETGFYNTLCPNVSIEDLIESAVVDGFNRLPGDTAGIVRLFFHDCFVRVSHGQAAKCHAMPFASLHNLKCLQAVSEAV